MSPTLRKARALHAFRAMGVLADELEWWSPGVPLADGKRCADVVCPPPPAPVRPFDQLALPDPDQELAPA